MRDVRGKIIEEAIKFLIEWEKECQKGGAGLSLAGVAGIQHREKLMKILKGKDNEKD